MSAVTMTRPVTQGIGSAGLTGTYRLFLLNLRRERIPLVLWVYALVETVLGTYAGISGLYRTAAEREGLAAGIAANPGMVVLIGKVQSASIGGLTAWRIGVLGAVMVAIMAMLTVVRRTRADEESGRTELLASGVVGRAAPLIAGLATAWSASLLIGALIAAGLIVGGQPVTGSLILGGSDAGIGLVFGSMAGVACQLLENSRTANAWCGMVLGLAFGIRGVGDVNSRMSGLNWLSPLGWVSLASAYAANRPAVLLLFLLATAVGTGLSLWLLGRRDLGAGFFAVGLGPATGASLKHSFALALRLQRAGILGWVGGLAVFGAVIGSVSADAQSLLSTSPQVETIIHQLGGPGALSKAFLAAMGSIVGLLASGLAISAVLRARTEELAGRLEPILATAVSRTRWLAGHLALAIVGSVLSLTVAGLVTGVVFGGRTGDLAGGLGSGLQSMLAPLPAVLVMAGLATCLVGVAPRLTGIAWGALGVAVLVGQLGPTLHLPAALIGLSPFTHLAALPADPMKWWPVVVLTIIAAGLITLGLGGFRRRDIG